jgi:EPS-associated MarR family transcriptional regulator
MNCALQGGSVSNQLNSNHEIHLKVLREIEGNPEITQRELAQHLGVSLGKVNYCLKALIDRGWVKANNFKNSNKKVAYAYLLTPNGLEEKAKITVRFLRQRIRDFELIKKEIAELEAEVGGVGDRNR